MSKGPGRIERAIRVAFTENGSRSYSVMELAAIAYPGVNRIEKKHRVSVIRAANNAANALGWWYWQAEAPGHPLYYCNPLDVRSYALCRIRVSYLGSRDDQDHLERLLDDPSVHNSRWAWIQPGGAWFQHVEINRARREGDEAKADAMNVELNAGVARQMAALGAMRG